MRNQFPRADQRREHQIKSSHSETKNPNIDKLGALPLPRPRVPPPPPLPSHKEKILSYFLPNLTAKTLFAYFLVGDGQGRLYVIKVHISHPCSALRIALKIKIMIKIITHCYLNDFMKYRMNVTSSYYGTISRYLCNMITMLINAALRPLDPVLGTELFPDQMWPYLLW